LSPITTPARAAGFIGTAEDVTERRAWEERITYQAQHDPLTGLLNRRRLIEVLQDLLTSKTPSARCFAVIFMDLDGFKSVNDTYGHEAGDQVLIEVARRMQRTSRGADILARVAGDEFVIILNNIITVADAEAAARRHLLSLAEPYQIARHQVTISASIGLALPAIFDTPETILRAADQVMYDAKAAGRGDYRLAPSAGSPASMNMPMRAPAAETTQEHR
jgi:diguanylate cyclase (GGDEF)-like protein